MVGKVALLLFGFWIVLGGMFLLVDFLLQVLKIRESKQERIHAIVFLCVFFAWWTIMYFMFV